MSLVAVDPGVYEGAGDVFRDVNASACDLVAGASTGASGGAGMAGVDASGKEWATAYDAAAPVALVAGQTLVASLGLFGDLLSASGANHAAAEAASTCPGSFTAPPAPPVYAGQSGSGSRAVSVGVAAPPSADGIGGNEPPGWWLVAHAVAAVWPNGDEDRLRTVGAAWTTAGEDLQTGSTRLNVAIGDISAIVSPEADQAGAACTDLREQMYALGDAYLQIGASCSGYADHLVATRQDTVDILAGCLAWSAANQLVGLVGAALTAGQSEWFTQAAEVGIIAGYAARVDAVLAGLAEAVRAVHAGLETATETIRTVSAAIATRVPATVQAAVEVLGRVSSSVLATRSDWAQLADVLAQAARTKGMFGLGTLTAEQTDAVGMAWVGPGARLSENGKAWVSADGLRQYRPADWKPGWQEFQANLECRLQPKGRWGNNGHISVEG